MLPIFITGNKNKVAYLNATLGITLSHQSLDLEEIQSPDPFIVAEHKARQAYEHIKQPVLIEDTSLSFTALNGLPGTFVKFFVESPNGLENMCRMLDGFDDRSAYARAVYAYFDGKTYKTFFGKLPGVIANHPRGDGGYGWDKIFEPEGYNGLTRAELSVDDDHTSYGQIRDTEGLRAFLKSLE